MITYNMRTIAGAFLVLAGGLKMWFPNITVEVGKYSDAKVWGWWIFSVMTGAILIALGEYFWKPKGD